MKKGFTLIELLAVIVILAIVALIAIPTISGIVERARKGAAEQSANGYNDAVNKQTALNLMDSNDENDINEGIYDAPFDSKYNIKVKGQTPTKGWVEVVKNGVNRYSLVIGDYVVSYDGETKTIVKGTDSNKKPQSPIIVYRYSSDKLLIGDKIDLENKKYTNYHKYISSTSSYDSINQTKNMVGIYSTNINDVLTINKEFNGNAISSRSNVMYFKHAINEDGIITKTEICLTTSWGTFCQDSGGGLVYDEENNKIVYKPQLFDTRINELLSFFKWNKTGNISEYNGITCRIGSSSTYCNNDLIVDEINQSRTIIFDIVNGNRCVIDNTLESYCY